MSASVIAIFDIGKTNKKVFLFDENYQICFEKSMHLPDITDEDGFPCENVDALTQWVKSSFQDLLAWHEFEIKALNISAHGASFVHIDEEGRTVAPLYNYLKTYPEELKNKFYNTYGGENHFARITASPVLGNLNAGMQLYWLKHERTELFRKIKYSLHLPEYISYLFTKIPVSGITSIGCHTNLWDFTQNHYHEWVTKEGILDKLAPIHSSSETNRINIQQRSMNAGIGLHDSSAALIPYLTCFTEPFILISTGTWCISMNPFNHSPLTDDELNQDCLCYLTYEGNPVKSSRLFAGFQHEKETKRLSAYFNVSEDFYNSITYQSGLKQTSTSTTYQSENLSAYSSFAEAYIHFMMSLVKQQVTSTNLVLKNSNVTRIFVDGGFSHNSIYMNLLAEAYPDIKVYAATVAQATAIGAALAIHSRWNHKPIDSNMIKLVDYSTM